MSSGSFSAPYGVRTFATLLVHRYRASSRTTTGSILGGMGLSMFGYGFGSSTHQTFSSYSSKALKSSESKMEHETNSRVQSSDPDHPRGNIFSCVKWILGSVLPLIFSFWKQKWDSMLKLEGKVEEVVKEAEEVAEVVEKVATKTEKLSAEVAEKLDNGELKEVALMVEHASTSIAKDARMTEDFIHKVSDLKQLEAMVEPIVEKIKHKT